MSHGPKKTPKAAISPVELLSRLPKTSFQLEQYSLKLLILLHYAQIWQKLKISSLYYLKKITIALDQSNPQINEEPTFLKCIFQHWVDHGMQTIHNSIKIPNVCGWKNKVIGNEGCILKSLSPKIQTL